MKFSADGLIQYSYFFLFLFSVIVFFDVLIRFKSPIRLKIFFLLFVLSILIISFCSFIRTAPGQYFFLIKICKIVLGTSIVQIFTNLYFIQQRRIANIYTIAAYSFYIFLIFYVKMVGYDTVFTKSSILNNSYNLPLYLNLIIEIDFISANLFVLYYIYNILFKFSFNNIYFKEMQVWTFSFFMLLLAQLILVLLYAFLEIPYQYKIFVSILFNLFLLLIILYRPSFINKNGSKISFGLLFKRDSSDYKINEIDFDFHFYNNMYYKSQTANLLEFSNIMGVSKDALFNHIYFKYSMSFDDLINKNRVKYFIEIMKKPESKNLTIDALGKEAGFSSRQNLYKPFKKFHGGNPSDLLDALGD
jgi:hypothetical protein